MKITTTRLKLAEAVQAVKGLVSKDGLSVFSRVRLDASGCLSVTGTNGDVQVEWRLDGGTISKTGTATVPGAAFAAFVGAMPDGNVEINVNGGKKVVLSGLGISFCLSAGDAADYPTMAGPNGEKVDIDMEAVKLREMLRKVKFAAATNGARAILEGVNVNLANGNLSMTATDGRRLAHVEANTCAKGRTDFTLHSRTVAILYGLLDRMADGDVMISCDGRAMRVVGDKWCLTSKVVDGVYPSWHRVVPENLPHRATMKRSAFLEAIGRVSLAADDSSGIKVTLRNMLAEFEARNDMTYAKAQSDECRIDECVKGEFRLNPRLMRDALESIDEDFFSLYFGEDPASPIKLTCSLPWLAVVMPYRKN